MPPKSKTPVSSVGNTPAGSQDNPSITSSQDTVKSTTTIYRCSAPCNNKIRDTFNAYLHPLLGVLVCRECYTNYGDGDFTSFPEGVDETGDDNYCRWCVDGGDLFGCHSKDENGYTCHYVFCNECIQKNVPDDPVLLHSKNPEFQWICYACDPSKLEVHRKRAAEIVKELADKEFSVLGELRNEADNDQEQPIVEAASKEASQQVSELASDTTNELVSQKTCELTSQTTSELASQTISQSLSQTDSELEAKSPHTPEDDYVEASQGQTESVIDSQRTEESMTEQSAGIPESAVEMVMQVEPYPDDKSVDKPVIEITTDEEDEPIVHTKPGSVVDKAAEKMDQSSIEQASIPMITTVPVPIVESVIVTVPLEEPTKPVAESNQTDRFDCEVPMEEDTETNKVVAQNGGDPEDATPTSDTIKKTKRVLEVAQNSESVVLGRGELKQRLAYFSGLKESCIGEITSKFDLIIEAFQSEHFDDKLNSLINKEIESLRRPMLDLDEMLNDLQNLSKSFASVMPD